MNEKQELRHVRFSDLTKEELDEWFVAMAAFPDFPRIVEQFRQMSRQRRKKSHTRVSRFVEALNGSRRSL